MRIINAVKKAEKLQRESKFTKALLIYEKIDKNLNSNSFDKEWLYYLRLNEGHCARLAGSFKKAIRYYNLALKLAKKIDEVSVADALSGMGTTLRAIGKLEQALKSLDVAYEIYKRLNDIEGQAYILWAKGGTFRFMGLIDHAFKSFEEAFVIYKSLGNKAGMGYSLCGLGGASRVMGNFEESLEYYTEANKIFKRIKDKFGVAYSYCGIANANRMMQNFDEAKKYFLLATKNYEEIGDKVSYAYTLWGEGTLAKILGNTDESIDKFSKAEKIFLETGDKRGLIYTELGKIELKFIKTGKISERKLKSLLAISTKYGYNFERLHVILLESIAKGMNIDKIHNEYLSLGSKFLDKIELKVPLNLP